MMILECPMTFFEERSVLLTCVFISENDLRENILTNDLVLETAELYGKKSGIYKPPHAFAVSEVKSKFIHKSTFFYIFFDAT